MRITRPMQPTAEDESIFLRRIERMEYDWIYEDGDRADADRMLQYMRDRARWDLASAAVRIEG